MKTTLKAIRVPVLILACALLLAQGCATPSRTQQEKRGTFWKGLTVFPKLTEREKQAAGGVTLDLEQVKAEILAHVTALCEGEPRNFRNVKRLTEAGDFIAGAFEASGYRVTRQSYVVQGNTYFNVIAELPENKPPRPSGTPPQEGNVPLVVVGGHYDVCGNTPGADDNASAVAVMLALAKAWAPLADAARVRVQFVAYTLEEPPFFNTDDMGSRVHAKSLSEQNVTPECVIVLEMLGYYNDGKRSQRYPSGIAKVAYPSVGNFLLALTHPSDKKAAKAFYSLARGYSNLNVEYIALPEPAANFSDHYSYWKHGIPAFVLTDTAWYRTPHYHQRSDTPDTLDYARLAETVQLLARYLYSR